MRENSSTTHQDATHTSQRTNFGMNCEICSLARFGREQHLLWFWEGIQPCTSRRLHVRILDTEEGSCPSNSSLAERASSAHLSELQCPSRASCRIRCLTRKVSFPADFHRQEWRLSHYRRRPNFHTVSTIWPTVVSSYSSQPWFHVLDIGKLVIDFDAIIRSGRFRFAATTCYPWY